MTLPYTFPGGYAQRLGQVLQENTHVSTITIQLKNMVPSSENGDQLNRSEILEFVEPMLSYIRSGTAMKRVVIHSNHSDDVVNKYLVVAVLDAMFGNRGHIRELTCTSSCTVSIAQFTRLMRASMLTTLDIHFLSFSEYSPSERSSIEAAFGSSYLLESLRVHTQDDNMATLILNGLKAGHNRVERYQLRELKLKCTECYGLQCWTALSELVHATTHLQHLQLESLLCDQTDLDAFPFFCA
jgi:hypothetical protein